MSALTAARAGLATCPACHQLTRPAAAAPVSLCPRCHAHVYIRKPASIARTCAYLIAAYALYVPANLLPVMSTEQFFAVRSDTIMSGVAYLWLAGSWPLATIVFLASIVLPLAKLLALTYLVLAVELRLAVDRVRQVRLYRLMRSIGRWSMLDIFVAAVLAACVQIKSLAAVRPGSGALAFAAVVVLTMLAVQAFDPRLIWDEKGDGDG